MDMRSLIAAANVNLKFQELCESPAVSRVAVIAAYQLMPCFIRKIIMASMSPLKRRRYEGRQFVSHARHPSRSKFKGSARCFRQRFNGRAAQWL